MSTPPSPNDLTRQQLDELDNLLQRMLTLPVSGAMASAEPEPVAAPLPEMPAVPSGSWRSDAATLAKTPYLAEPSPRVEAVLVPVAAPEPETEIEPEEPAWGADLLARYGASPASRLFAPPTPDTGVPPTGTTVRGVDAPALPADFRSLLNEEPAPAPAPMASFTPAASFSPIPAPEPMPTPAPAPGSGSQSHSVPVVLWPVFGLNWVLELVLKLLGPLGAGVTFTPAKHFLGLVGVLLLVASAAWTARGMGWVAFDVPPLPQLPWQR